MSMFNWWRGSGHAPSLDAAEDLRRQCLIDASSRLRGGVFVYAVYWLVAALPTGLYARQSTFVLVAFVGLLLIGLLRTRLDKMLPKLAERDLHRATALFRILPVCNGLYWGALTAVVVLWPEAQSVKHYMLTIAICMVIAGAMTMAIDPFLRLAFPVAVIAPATVGLLLDLNVENGVFAILCVVFAVPLARLSRVVHDDYWNGLRARRELQGKAEELERITLTDTLTQLPNRRFFDGTLSSDWAQARRLNAPVTVAIVDLDHFKRINDSYGHPFGDAVLVAAASALRKALIRPGDVVARYGGEEFAVLLPHTDAAGATAVAQRMLDGVAAISFDHAGVAVTLTCSIGMCTMTPSGDTSMDAIVRLADRALYLAKQQGRNRVVAVGPDEA